MKKITGASTILLFMITFVSAGSLSSGLSKGMNQLLDAIRALLSPFFGAILGGSGEVLFQKILFLVIIFSIVFLVIKNMPVFKGNSLIIWIISVSVSLLATRFMSGDLLKTMLMPYTVLGVVLTSTLPLIIMFVFIQTLESKTLRKILWSFYIAVFLVIWSTRYAQIEILSYIYMGSAIIAFFFLLFDGTIRKAILKSKMDDLDQERRAKMRAEISEELTHLEDQYTKHHIDEAHYAKIKRRLTNQMNSMSKK